MKHFLSISVVALALFVGAAGAAPAANAQNSGAIGDACQTGGECSSDSCVDGKCVAAAADPVTPAADAKAETNTSVPDQNVVAADNPQVLTLDDGGAMSKVMVFLMGIFAWLLGVAVITLDNAVYFTVVTMGDYVRNLSAVGVAWRILRDVGNIMLIFGFLAIGISVILDTERLGYGTKMLPSLLIAAVFLNFSLFITEAVIDGGNLFATQFYTQINGGNPAGEKGINMFNEGISQKILSQLGLVTVYSDALNNNLVLKSGNTALIGFMSIILFMITAFVFFSLAFILIARFVMLIFVIILSPVGFAGFAIPKLKTYSDQWKDMLIKQTISAPVLLFLLYIALVIITDANFLGFGPNGEWSGFIENNGNMNLAGFASQILSFLVAMGILLMVIIATKKLSVTGADFATKWAGKATFGATAWGMRSTIGRGAYYTARGLRQSKAFNKFDALTGRATTRMLDRGAKGNFDLRGTGVLKNLPGGGVSAGDAQKGGFTEARKQNIKQHEAAAKEIEEAHKEALKNTSKDEAAISKAEEDRKQAAKAKNDAQTAKTNAQEAEQTARTRQAEDKAEMNRLEEEKKKDKYWGTDPKNVRKLEEAEKKSETSNADFAAAAANLGKAAAALTKATEDETNAEKAKKSAEGAAETRMKESIKANKIAYAEGIDHPLNPITFVAYGPDTAAAARKIKSSLKEKPTKDKFLDMAKKMAKEIEDVEGKEKTEDEKVETPKPEAKPEAAK